MNNHLGAHFACGKVVDAAGAVGNVCEQEREGACEAERLALRPPSERARTCERTYSSTISAIAQPYTIKPSGICRATVLMPSRRM